MLKPLLLSLLLAPPLLAIPPQHEARERAREQEIYDRMQHYRYARAQAKWEADMATWEADVRLKREIAPIILYGYMAQFQQPYYYYRPCYYGRGYYGGY